MPMYDPKKVQMLNQKIEKKVQMKNKLKQSLNKVTHSIFKLGLNKMEEEQKRLSSRAGN